jgi:hypothetical protein
MVRLVGTVLGRSGVGRVVLPVASSLGTTKGNPMSEHSREQVEARLAEVIQRGDLYASGRSEEIAAGIAPTVAAMLAEARAEVDSRIRRAILQPHLRASTEYGPDYCSTCSEAINDWVAWPCAATEAARAEVVWDVQAVPRFSIFIGTYPGLVRARDLDAALARHMPAAVRDGGTDGPQESAGPSDGRTVADARMLGNCGEALGDMRCQLRRGHDGDHEDYRAVAQERRA